MDFSIPPEFWWSTDNLSASIFLQGVDQKILPCGQGKIDSVKINPSLLMMTDCLKSTKIWEAFGNPSSPPLRFTSTLEIFQSSLVLKHRYNPLVLMTNAQVQFNLNDLIGLLTGCQINRSRVDRKKSAKH